MILPPAIGLRLPLALDTASLSAVQDRLATYLAEAGCGPDIRFRVALVVEEVATNLIRHARPLGASQARIEARCRDGHAAVALLDDGPAFDPLCATRRPLADALSGAHEGGFGLHLIRGQSDAARYHRAEGWNRLELEFAPRHA